MKSFRPIVPTRRTAVTARDTESLKHVRRRARELETEMKKLEVSILDAPIRQRERQAVARDTVPPLDDLTHRARPFANGATRQAMAKMRSETISNFVGFLFILLFVAGLVYYVLHLVKGM